nr:MAG TPA: hypothetical protein [Caudoviricetes sp.]
MSLASSMCERMISATYSTPLAYPFASSNYKPFTFFFLFLLVPAYINAAMLPFLYPADCLIFPLKLCFTFVFIVLFLQYFSKPF